MNAARRILPCTGRRSGRSPTSRSRCCRISRRRRSSRWRTRGSLTETREALEQQTATAEVLQVINSSPGDLAPVFDAMLEKAVRLCGFDFASLWTYDGTAFQPVAKYQIPEAIWVYMQQHTPPSFVRLAGGERFVRIADLRQDAAYQSDFTRDLRRLGLDMVRSLLIVPLRKNDALLGLIVAYSQEVQPFSNKQIAVLENFAAQAVIAMENARLLGELRARTDEIAAWNRELEDRVAAQVGGIGAGGKTEAVSRAATGRTDRRARRRKHPRNPSPRHRRRVLRPARVYRLRRDRRAGGGARSAARVSRRARA